METQWQLTTQQILDKVRDRATNPVRSESAFVCRYRSDSGLACFVGCIIPDELYSPEMEGCSVDQLIACGRFPEAAEMLRPHRGMLKVLQGIHDWLLPDAWLSEIAKCARLFNAE